MYLYKNRNNIYPNKINYHQINILFLIITFLLLFLGIRFFSVCAVFAFVLNIIVFFFLPTELIFCDLFFLLSLASIYKYGPGTVSFFTVLELTAIVVILFREKRLDAKFTIILCIYMCYVLIVCFINSTFDLLNFVKQIMNFFILYLFVRTVNKSIFNKVIIFYVFGVIASSIVGLFSKYIPNFYEYIRYVGAYIDGETYTRFTGLFGDPNYYSVNLILGLAGLILLYYKKEINIIFWICFICLSLFGFLTYSKSFILMYCGVCCMFIYVCLKMKKIFITSAFFLAFIGIFILGILGKIPIVNAIIERLTNFSDFDSLTTGRFHLWQTYIQYFIDNVTSFVFGRGLVVERVGDLGAHNTYIDYLYYLGLIGTVVNLSCLYICLSNNIGKKHVNLLNFSGVAIIFVMYFFLSMFFAFDLVFHIIIAWIYFKLDLKPKKLKIGG